MPATALVQLPPMEICPVAPGNAQRYVDQITGYVLWGVGMLFVIAVVIAIGAIVAGRLFSMPHASKVGVVSIVVVFMSAIAYMVLPGLIDSLLGSGCISSIGGQNPSEKPTR
jgi:hypothetical protein